MVHSIKSQTMRKAKSFMGFLLSAAMVMSLIPNGVVAANAEETTEEKQITIDIVQQPLIDVILTVGLTDITNMDVTNFEPALRQELLDRGVNVSRLLNIHKMESTEVDLSTAFDWDTKTFMNYNTATSGSTGTGIGNITVAAGGSNVNMVGNQSLPGKNAIYCEPAVDQQQRFRYQYNLTFGDSFNAAGMLLRSTKTLVSGGNTASTSDDVYQLSGYMLSFNNSKWKGLSSNSGGAIWKYEFKQGTNRTMFDTSTAGSKITLVKPLAISTSGTLNIVVDNDYIKVSGGGLSSPVTVPITEKTGAGFGFFSDHYSHGCSSIGSFKLTGIALEEVNIKSFTELLDSATWREGSLPFVVNVSDRAEDDFGDEVKMGEILTRCLNNDLQFVAWGPSSTKAVNELFISRNNNNGTFIQTTNQSSFDAAIEATADYIVELLYDIEYQGRETVIIDEPIELTVNPESAKMDSSNDAFPNGRWRIVHDSSVYENPNGQYVNSGLYLDDLTLESLPKVGKYSIFYENNIIREIYAHRKPVASFAMTVKNGNVTTKSTSYDLDDYSTDNGFGPGLQAEKWQYKLSTATEWTEGVPTTIGDNETYVVMLEVQDNQGIWSTPVTKYISGSDEYVEPVADFNFSNPQISKYNTSLTINDASYDPKGDALTKYQWTVKKGTTQIASKTYTSFDYPKIDFLQHGAGKYEYNLVVTNAHDKSSAAFTRYLTVVEDIEKPEVAVTPVEGKWTPTTKEHSINFEASDTDSKLDYTEYALTNSASTPAASEFGNRITFTNNEMTTFGSVIITDPGSYYFHYKVADKAGNTQIVTRGPFQIDYEKPLLMFDRIEELDTEVGVTYPIMPLANAFSMRSTISTDVNYLTNKAARVYLKATDYVSGVDSVKFRLETDVDFSNAVDAGNNTYYFDITDTFEGTIYVMAKDNAANESDMLILNNIRVVNSPVNIFIDTPEGWTNAESLDVPVSVQTYIPVESAVFRANDSLGTVGELKDLGDNEYTATLTAEGIYTFVVEMTNEAGTVSSVESGEVKIDRTRPAIHGIDYQMMLNTADELAAPALLMATENMLAVEPIELADYSINGGESWQKSNIFTGLDTNTGYSITYRLMSDDRDYTVSAALNANTLDAPYFESDDTSITVTYNGVDAEYSIDNQATWQTESTFDELTPNTTYTIWHRLPDKTKSGNEYIVMGSSEVTTLKTPLSHPVLEEVAESSITVEAVEGAEYSIDGGENWQASNTFTGLEADTTYEIIYRILEDGEYIVSPGLMVNTLPLEEEVLDAPVLVEATETSITVEAIENAEYSIDGGENWQKSNTFTGLDPDTDYSIIYRISTEDGHEQSPALSVSTAAEEVTEEEQEYTLEAEEITATSITLVAVDNAEYSLDEEDWQTSNVFDSLTPETDYTVYMRVELFDENGDSSGYFNTSETFTMLEEVIEEPAPEEEPIPEEEAVSEEEMLEGEESVTEEESVGDETSVEEPTEPIETPDNENSETGNTENTDLSEEPSEFIEESTGDDEAGDESVEDELSDNETGKEEQSDTGVSDETENNEVESAAEPSDNENETSAESEEESEEQSGEPEEQAVESENAGNGVVATDAVSNDNIFWYNTKVTISVSDIFGVANSGVDKVWYKLDGTIDTDWIEVFEDENGEYTFMLEDDFEGKVWARCQDVAGNLSNDFYEEILIDRTNPDPSVLVNIEKGEWGTDSGVVEIEGFDENTITSVKVKIETMPGNVPYDEMELVSTPSKSFSDSITLDEDGDYLLTITVTDKAGNKTVLEESVKIDKTKPFVIGSTLDAVDNNGNIIEADSILTGKNMRITVDADDATSGIHHIEYRTEYGEWQKLPAGETSFLINHSYNGSVELRAVDNAGNISESIFTDEFVIDRAAPVLDYKDTYYSNDSFVIVMDASDDISGVDSFEYRTQGGSWTKLDGTNLKLDAAHDTPVEVRVTDKVGNVSQTYVFYPDKTAPVVNGAFTNTDESGNMTASISVKEEESGLDYIEYKTSGSDWTKVNGTEINLGTYRGNIQVRATDKVGNVSAVYSFSTESSAPVINNDTVTYTNGQASIKVDVTNSEFDLDYIEYKKTGSDKWIKVTGTTINLGDYQGSVVIRAVDKAGTASQEYTVTTDTTAPVIYDHTSTYQDDDSIIIIEASDVGSGVDYIEYQMPDSDEWVKADGNRIELGTYRGSILVHAVDKAGNVSKNYTCTTNSIAPTINSDDITYENGKVEINVGVTEGEFDTDHIEYKDPETGEWVPVTGNTIQLPEGTKGEIPLRVIDKEGNISDEYIIQTDTQPPVVTDENSEITYNKDGSVNITVGDASDNDSGVDYIEYKNPTTDEWVKVESDDFDVNDIPGLENEESVEIRVTDKAGNTSDPVALPLDKTPPTVAGKPAYSDGVITVSPNGSDGHSGLDRIEYKDPATGEWKPVPGGSLDINNIPGLEDAEDVELRGVDIAGNVSSPCNSTY